MENVSRGIQCVHPVRVGHGYVFRACEAVAQLHRAGHWPFYIYTSSVLSPSQIQPSLGGCSRLGVLLPFSRAFSPPGASSAPYAEIKDFAYSARQRYTVPRHGGRTGLALARNLYCFVEFIWLYFCSSTPGPTCSSAELPVVLRYVHFKSGMCSQSGRQTYSHSDNQTQRQSVEQTDMQSVRQLDTETVRQTSIFFITCV